MARINIEDTFESKLEFRKLLQIVGGNHFNAMGRVVYFMRIAQLAYGAGTPVLRQQLEDEDLVCMIESGWAIEIPGGYAAKDADKHFGWYKSAVEAGRKSVEARRAKSQGSLSDPQPPSRVVQRPSTDTEPLSPSLALSPSTKTIEDLPIGSDGAKCPASLPGGEGPTALAQLDGLLQKALARKKAKEGPEQTELVPASTQKPPKIAVNGLIGVYVKAWQGRYRTKARPDVTKAIGVFTALLKDRTGEELSELVQVYCQMEDDWFKKKGHDIATFRENIGKVALARDKGHERLNGEKHWTELADEMEANGQAEKVRLLASDLLARRR